MACPRRTWARSASPSRRRTRTSSTPPSSSPTARAASGAPPTAARPGRSAATTSRRHRSALLPGDLRRPAPVRSSLPRWTSGGHVTEDGGKTFETGVGERPTSTATTTPWPSTPTIPTSCSWARDGGLYESWDLGRDLEVRRQPADDPVLQGGGRLRRSRSTTSYGGTQDNNTQYGPVAHADSMNGIRNSDWRITIFGDGHQPRDRPDQSRHHLLRVAAGVTWCASTARPARSVYIQPQPEPGEPAERWNWDSPILISPARSGALYFASQRVWRSDDRGDSWRPISPTLTRGPGPLEAADDGPRVERSTRSGTSTRCRTSATSPRSPSRPWRRDGLYVGTDDGLIQVTETAARPGAGSDSSAGVPGPPSSTTSRPTCTTPTRSTWRSTTTRTATSRPIC